MISEVDTFQDGYGSFSGWMVFEKGKEFNLQKPLLFRVVAEVIRVHLRNVDRILRSTATAKSQPHA